MVPKSHHIGAMALVKGSCLLLKHVSQYELGQFERSVLLYCEIDLRFRRAVGGCPQEGQGPSVQKINLSRLWRLVLACRATATTSGVERDPGP